MAESEKLGTAGRILIADDDPACRESTQLYLEKKGYSCVSVPDSKSAVQKLRDEPFDLLISDIHMPGNENLGLVENVPQVADGLPIILMTGNPTMDSAMKSVRLPVMAYLVKPADPQELTKLVQQAVANSRAQRSLSASRQKLAQWAEDLGKIEEAMRSSSGAKSGTPINNYLNVTLQNLLSILMDWKEVMDAAPSPAGGVEKTQSQPIVAALRETIEVLERTKQSFKSRELGDLRKKLEDLLQNSRRETARSGTKV